MSHKFLDKKVFIFSRILDKMIIGKIEVVVPSFNNYFLNGSVIGCLHVHNLLLLTKSEFVECVMVTLL